MASFSADETPDPELMERDTDTLPVPAGGEVSEWLCAIFAFIIFTLYTDFLKSEFFINWDDEDALLLHCYSLFHRF